MERQLDKWSRAFDWVERTSGQTLTIPSSPRRNLDVSTDAVGWEPLPISHVLFDQLRDNSANLPGLDAALVHVQVHNRSRTPTNNVRVWAIYCNASAGVPGLNVSPSLNNAFAFWSQFNPATGQIIPNLPADSPWRSVGPPQTLSGIDAANPKVASWSWSVPTPASGDPGHYCMVAFVHCASSPINEASLNVDEMTPRNRQMGQKNLHIGPPLPPGPTPGGGPGGRSGVPRLREIVEFHNPEDRVREVTLAFDLRGLPPQLRLSFQLTPLDTARPLAESLSGVAAVHGQGLGLRLKRGLARFFEWLGGAFQCLGCWIENWGRRLLGHYARPCTRPPRGKPPGFLPTIYEASPSALATVRGVRLPPFGAGVALLAIENAGNLEPGSEHFFQVQQLVREQVIGGSVYVVRIAGDKKLRPPLVLPPMRLGQDPRQLERLERESESLRWVPPWAEDVVKESEQRLGKKV